jgi:hypothetical protein
MVMEKFDRFIDHFDRLLTRLTANLNIFINS